jgi:hypothetical protein
LLAAHPLAKVKASKIDRRANVRYLSSEEVARLSRALEINRIERDGRPDNAQIVLPEHGFVSRAAQSDAIFVYSLTTEPTLEIGAAADRAVVEIFDPTQFVRRVRAGLPWRWADTLIHDTVRYWSPANPLRLRTNISDAPNRGSAKASICGFSSAKRSSTCPPNACN